MFDDGEIKYCWQCANFIEGHSSNSSLGYCRGERRDPNDYSCFDFRVKKSNLTHEEKMTLIQYTTLIAILNVILLAVLGVFYGKTKQFIKDILLIHKDYIDNCISRYRRLLKKLEDLSSNKSSDEITVKGRIVSTKSNLMFDIVTTMYILQEVDHNDKPLAGKIYHITSWGVNTCYEGYKTHDPGEGDLVFVTGTFRLSEERHAPNNAYGQHIYTDKIIFIKR